MSKLDFSTMGVSEAEFAERYSDIWNDKTKGKSPETETRPHLVLVGGVPASGKSHLLKGYDDKNYVQIDIDSLRSFHPKYDEWKYDQMMAKWTNPCADKWYSRLIEDCGKQGYNMVIETTLKNDEWLYVSQAFKNAGYKVDVKASVCPLDQSALSAHTRYEKDIAIQQHGRYVFFDVVESSNVGLPAAMENLAKSGVPDNCEIYRRCEPLCVVKQDDDVKGILAAERTRIKTPEEYVEMAKKWDDLKGMMTKRGASAAEYEQLRDFIGGTVAIMQKEGYPQENIDFLNEVAKTFEPNNLKINNMERE
jgi:UDP-N-acetylglucosamine kinase